MSQGQEEDDHFIYNNLYNGEINYSTPNCEDDTYYADLQRELLNDNCDKQNFNVNSLR